MNTFLYVLKLLSINIADALIAGAFFSGFMGSLYNGKKKYLGYALFAAIYTLSILLLNIASASGFLTNEELSMLLLLPMIALGYLYNLFFTKGSPLRKMLPIIIFLLSLTTVNVTLAFTFGIIENVFPDIPLYNNDIRDYIFHFAIDIIDKIALFYVTQGILRITKKDDTAIKSKEMLSIYLSPMITLIIIALLMPVISEADSIVIGVCLLLVIVLLFASSLITYHLYVRTIKNNQATLQLERMKQQQEYEKRHYDEQTEKYDEIRTIRHNIKNQLLYLLTAIKEERDDDAAEFISKLTQDIENTGDFVRTDNYAFNCILNAMIAKAKETGIRVKAQIPESIDANLDPSDVPVILGNLLENAIEASSKLDERKRRIEITIEQNLLGLMIRIGNSVGSSILKDNPDFLTDKADKEQHGLGVKSVKKLVQKYDGLMTCHEEESHFYWTLLFKKSADLT